jgi:hypothetical protein
MGTGWDEKKIDLSNDLGGWGTGQDPWGLSLNISECQSISGCYGAADPAKETHPAFSSTPYYATQTNCPHTLTHLAQPPRNPHPYLTN